MINEDVQAKITERKRKTYERKSEIENQKNFAKRYLYSVKAEGGIDKYIAIRIRDGYIGKEMTKDGRVLQPYRTRPRGTMIAFKNPEYNDEMRIAISYLNDNIDKDIPILGLVNAFKYALEDTKGLIFDSPKEDDKVKVYGIMNEKAFETMSQNDKDLYEFFKIRALCYFYPEIYSHSRGTDKIEYPNYEKIHKNRARVLGD